MIESDIEQCLALTMDRFLYREDQLPLLGRLWLRLIREKTGVPPHVITDASSPSRVAHFGTMAFVDDERADRYHDLTSPKIGYSMAEELEAGGHPFLRRADVADANARGGVNLVVLHHGSDPRYEESIERLRAASYEIARRYFTGWNLRSYTNEVFGRNPERDGKQMGEALGFRVLRYTSAQLHEAGIPEDKAPWVWLATRQDALAKPAVLPLAMLFLSFSVPKFGFSMVEQDALNLALEGFTDEAIAQTMGASLSTIKKRFRAVYDKVQDKMGDDRGPEPLSRFNDGARGLETRRRLLNYLREHPEELRPYAHSFPTQTRSARSGQGALTFGATGNSMYDG
jgi:DNA-binding CsgD family transcriptional regulator